MPTIMHPLAESPEDHRLLHEIHIGGFLRGECYAFAIALHRGLGWPLVGLMQQGVAQHAGVRSPHGPLYDIRGPLSEHQFAAKYVNPPFYFQELTEKDLYATRPIDDIVIRRARFVAEAIWPNLPWIDAIAPKVKAFVDALEKLSREHGFWVSGATPIQMPILFAAEGDEDGYDVRVTMNGRHHTIERRLK